VEALRLASLRLLSASLCTHHTCRTHTTEVNTLQRKDMTQPITLQHTTSGRHDTSQGSVFTGTGRKDTTLVYTACMRSVCASLPTCKVHVGQHAKCLACDRQIESCRLSDGSIAAGCLSVR